MKKRKHFRINQDSNTQISVQFRLLKFSSVIISLLASFCCRCRSGLRRRVVRRVVPGVSKDRTAFNFRVKDNLTPEMKAVRSSLTSATVPCYASTLLCSLRTPKTSFHYESTGSLSCSVGLLVLRGDSFHGESTGSVTLLAQGSIKHI